MAKMSATTKTLLDFLKEHGAEIPPWVSQVSIDAFPKRPNDPLSIRVAGTNPQGGTSSVLLDDEKGVREAE